jgi:predicted ATPase/class 3 adenylate cyclase
VTTVPEPTRSPLVIHLFGPLEVQVNGHPLPRLRTRKEQWLLALLALRTVPLDRSWVAGALWPDSPESTALASLRKSLNELRRALGPEADRLHSPTPRTLALRLADADVDVLAFDAGVAAGDLAALSRAVSLYRGPLLEACGEEWVFQERSRREVAYLGALERLAAHARAEGDAAAAESYLRRAVAVDPLRESAHRALMQTMAAGGNYAAALLAYRELRLLLHREMNAEPDAQTTALFQQIRAEARRRAEAPPPVRASKPASSAAGGAPGGAPALLPEGTVTFLFTDLESSVKLWEQYPEAMRLALPRHDALVGHAVEAHGGQVFKTVGDAFYTAFSTPPDAVAAALEAQRALDTEPWPETGPLRMRVALHTGVAQLRGDDYFGAPLNRVARLLEAGHGGQVLLSSATQELVRDHLPDGVSLRDLGEHRLRDLARPERVYQLLHPDHPDTFPPLRGLDAGPHNLPVQPTPLIGREREVATLQQMLRRAEVRLVTLTGPGGTGKTRLALQVGADLLEEFGDGVFFVDLAPIRDPGLVASTVAQTLGVRETGGASLVESLKRYLREKQLLLVLDNFEQVLDAAPTVAELLGAARRLKVLVTSRAVLRVRGEQEFPVPPLALPDPRRLPPVEALSQYAAVELFIQRAVNARADFTVTNENAPAVAEICHRLDGLPLAIELAAARVRLLPPQAMLARLESRLKLLTGGARDLPARQQTLRNTIAWSYDLLGEAEKRLFGRLSMFVGGCTLEAAEAVGNIEGELQIPVLDGVASLLDQSLLWQIESEIRTAGGGEARFVMLETIREFGLERLEERGEAEAVRRQHARYFLRLAEEAARGNRGPALRESLDRVEAEHDNLRAALMWSHQEPTGGDTEQRLVAALGLFWDHRGYWREKEQWLEGALARGRPGVQCPPSGEDDREPLATWGQLLLAADRYEESIAIWRQLGDTRWLARALASWGNHRSVAACEEAVSLFRELGDRWDLVTALYFLGNAALAEGHYPQARSHYEESLALARELGGQEWLAWPLSGLGDLARELGEYEAARSYYEETIALRREYGDAWLPHFLNGLGEVASAQGNLAEAGQAFEESLAIGRDRGLPEILIGALVGLGRVAWHRGEWELARTRGEEGLMIAEEMAERQGMARALLLLGRVAQAEGDSNTAHSRLRRSLRLCHELGERRELAERLEALAAVARAQGQLVRAARLLGAAAALRDTHGPPVPPIDQADREHQVAALRAAMGEETFATAWAAGGALSLHEAVALALEDDISLESSVNTERPADD